MQATHKPPLRETIMKTNATFWFCLILWFLNDHIFKAAAVGTPFTYVTGKLSDMAGLIVFPIALASALRWIFRVDLRTLVKISAVLTGLLFVAINVNQAWSDALHGLLPRSNAVRFHGTADLTDLLCLPLLLVPAYGGRQHAKSPRRPALLEVAGVVLCALATTATSMTTPVQRAYIVTANPAEVSAYSTTESLIFLWFVERPYTYANYRLHFRRDSNERLERPARPARPLTFDIPHKEIRKVHDPRMGRDAFMYIFIDHKLAAGRYYWQIQGDGLLEPNTATVCTDDMEQVWSARRTFLACSEYSENAVLLLRTPEVE